MLPHVELQPGDLEKGRSLASRDESGGTNLNMLERVFTQRVLFGYREQDRTLDIEVQVITLGDSLAWVALPGEIFVELGLDLKTDSPFGQTMVAELANGSIGYIPCARAYRHGNYEVVSARCAKGSGERLVAAALDLLAECFSSASQPPQK